MFVADHLEVYCSELGEGIAAFAYLQVLFTLLPAFVLSLLPSVSLLVKWQLAHLLCSSLEKRGKIGRGKKGLNSCEKFCVCL